jgi:hypothetical protein
LRSNFFATSLLISYVRLHTARHLLWHESPSKPVSPLVPLHPLLRSRETDESFRNKCLDDFRVAIIVWGGVQRLRAVFDRPPGGYVDGEYWKPGLLDELEYGAERCTERRFEGET